MAKGNNFFHVTTLFLLGCIEFFRLTLGSSGLLMRLLWRRLGSFVRPSISRCLLLKRHEVGRIVRDYLLGYGLEVFIIVFGEEGDIAHLECTRLLVRLGRLNLCCVLSLIILRSR